MSNLPTGAERDPFAPYNVEEKVFKVDINAKGLAWYEYYGHLDIDEAIEAIKSRIQAALSSLGVLILVLLILRFHDISSQ